MAKLLPETALMQLARAATTPMTPASVHARMMQSRLPTIQLKLDAVMMKMPLMMMLLVVVVVVMVAMMVMVVMVVTTVMVLVMVMMMMMMMGG